jgi:transposase
LGVLAQAHQFEAFLGLVPGERSSGEKRRVGRITKTGNARVRYLLVEAAWRILWSKTPRPVCLTHEREQKAEQHLEGRCRD